MKIQKNNYSTFSFRPPGVLKSTVSTSSRLRYPPIPAYDQQNLQLLSHSIDPKNPDPSELLNYIPPGMLFFSTLENAYFIIKEGMDGIIITEDHHFIEESLFYYKKKSSFEISASVSGNISILDEVFLSFDPDWMSYDHWMGYCLSKAYLASLYTPSTLQIVIPEYRQNNSITQPFISRGLYEESLEKTGLKPRITHLKDGVYKVKKLSFFQPNNYIPHSYFNFTDAKSVFHFLNKNIKYRNDLPTQFMIAQNPEFEPILSSENYLALTHICYKMNIPIIQLKTMDWDEQITLFSQAEFIIAPHCPELINLYFCQKDTKILELTSSNNKTGNLPAWPFLISSTNNIYYSFLDVNRDNLNLDLLTNSIRKMRAY